LTPEAGARRLLQEAFQLLPGIETEGFIGKISASGLTLSRARPLPQSIFSEYRTGVSHSSCGSGLAREGGQQRHQRI